MHARDPARFLFQIHDGIATFSDSITGVELNDNLLLSSIEERVPRHLAIDGFEFDVMVVIADAHPVRLHFVGQFVEDVGSFLPTLPRFYVFAGQARHDEKLIAESVIEFDRLRQVIPEQCVESDVRAATFEADIIEQLAQRSGIASVVTSELDGFVTHLPHGRHGADQIFRAFVAH